MVERRDALGDARRMFTLAVMLVIAVPTWICFVFAATQVRKTSAPADGSIP
jgi:hypothetical protein